MTADGLLKLPRSVGAIKHCSIRRLCFIPVMVPLDLFFFFKELLVISCFSFAVTEYFRMFFFLTPLFVYFSNKSCFFSLFYIHLHIHILCLHWINTICSRLQIPECVSCVLIIFWSMICYSASHSSHTSTRSRFSHGDSQLFRQRTSLFCCRRERESWKATGTHFHVSAY